MTDRETHGVPRRFLSGWIGVSAILLACGASGAPGHIQTTELTSAEIQSVARAVEASDEFMKAAERRTDQRLTLASSWSYEIESDAGAKREIAELLYFRYEGGVTIRTLVDLQTREVLRVETLTAYPTPLSPEEEVEAIRLAKEQSRQAQELFAGAGSAEIATEALTPVFPDPQDPRYGHRIVYVTFYRKTGDPQTITLEVDLTSRTVRAPAGRN